MKIILIILKTLVITYWAVAATLFSSMLFFPSAIDTLYTGYLQIVEVVEVPSEEEPLTCEALISECGYEELEISEEEPVIEDETSEEVVEEESEEPVIEDEEETTEPSEEDSETLEVEDETEEIVIEDETEEEPVIEDETVTVSEEFTPLTKEEFITTLEVLLVYSVIVMLPFTFLVFSLSKKHRDLSTTKKPEVVATVSDSSGKAAKATKIKYESIGLTGIRIKK